MNRSALCVFDSKLNLIVILKRKCEYMATWRSNPSIFLEQYSLPRGKCKNKREPLLKCAIREFIEETGFFVKECLLLDETVNLYWYDPLDKKNEKWQYKVFFLEASLEASNVIRIEKDQNVFIPLMNDSSERCVFSHYEFADVDIVSIDEYLREMELQLTKYGENNYGEFLSVLISHSSRVLQI